MKKGFKGSGFINAFTLDANAQGLTDTQGTGDYITIPGTSSLLNFSEYAYLVKRIQPLWLFRGSVTTPFGQHHFI